MTETSTEPPGVLYEPAPEPSRDGMFRAWVALVLLVVTIIALNRLAPPPKVGDATAGSLEFRFQSRYVLGVHRLFGSFLKTAAGSEEQLREALETSVTTADEAVCLVPVLAELAGPEEALQRVATILAERDDLDAEDEIDLRLLQTIYSSSDNEEEKRDESLLAPFRERRAYFADLALSHGLADDDPERQSVLHEARRTAVTMLGVGSVVGGGVLVGLVLFVIGFLLWRHGKLRPVYEDSVRESAGEEPKHHYVWTLVLFMIVTIVLGVLGGAVAEVAGQAAGLALTFLALPVLLWPMLWGVGSGDLRRAYGWHRGQGVLREIGSGLAAYLAGAPLLAFALLISLTLAQFVDKTPSHPLMEGLAEAPLSQIVVIVLLATVWAPLVEETIFRGGFYHSLRGRFGVLGAGLVSSVIFAIIHPQGILGVPPLVALAMILALVREWRGSLIGSVAIHAVHNGAATTVLLLMLG